MLLGLRNMVFARWAALLLLSFAAFKAAEFASGIFRGTAASVLGFTTMLVFFGAWLITEMQRRPSRDRLARRIRIGLLGLLIVALAWDSLRATHGVVANRMEYERLALVRKDMDKAEKKALLPALKEYESLL